MRLGTAYRRPQDAAAPDYPGERLIVCHNPVLGVERARKREDLLQAAERDFAAIQEAVKRARRPLRGIAKIARKVGAVLDRRHMAKHFDLAAPNLEQDPTNRDRWLNPLGRT